MNTKINETLKENFPIIIIFVLALLSLILFFEQNKNEKIETHLNQIREKYNSQYKIIYQNFSNLSQNTFYGIINKPNIYDNIKNAYNKDEKTQNYYRNKLYNIFLQDYSRLKAYNFKQIHFHTKDNKSFLRMHKPSKFGDDLSQARYSIVEVNKTLKPVDGFEIGKIVHGFRFVFPLFDENLEHIGSVEASVSSKFFENSYESNYQVDAHFLVRKDIVEQKVFKSELAKQVISTENSDYFLNHETINESFHLIHENFYSNQELKDIKRKMSQAENFVLLKKEAGEYITACFIPIKNVEGIKNSAYLVLYKKENYIQQVYEGFYKILFILFLSVVIFLAYLKYEHTRNEQSKQKDYMLAQQSKMASMGEMIGNIAHQWRQPLSVISTAASGMRLQKEFNILTDEFFYESTKSIEKSTQYLSQTIEDFRSFFNTNKEKKMFKIGDIIEQTIELFGTSLNQNNIKIIKNIEEIEIYSYPNELKQVFMNLVKNSKDAIEKDGLILINVYLHKIPQ